MTADHTRVTSELHNVTNCSRPGCGYDALHWHIGPDVTLTDNEFVVSKELRARIAALEAVVLPGPAPRTVETLAKLLKEATENPDSGAGCACETCTKSFAEWLLPRLDAAPTPPLPAPPWGDFETELDYATGNVVVRAQKPCDLKRFHEWVTQALNDAHWHGSPESAV